MGSNRYIINGINPTEGCKISGGHIHGYNHGKIYIYIIVVYGSNKGHKLGYNMI